MHLGGQGKVHCLSADRAFATYVPEVKLFRDHLFRADRTGVLRCIRQGRGKSGLSAEQEAQLQKAVAELEADGGVPVRRSH